MNSRMVKLNFHIDGHLVETRRLAMVEMEPGERVRDAIQTGAQVYGGGLLYAFVRAIPAGAQEFVELETETGLVTLVHALWVPVGAVMVGRGGQAVREPIYTGVKNYMEVVDG